MENAQIADMLDEIADLLELSEGDMLRIGAYRNAALTVRGLSRRLEDMVRDGGDLSNLPMLGRAPAKDSGDSSHGNLPTAAGMTRA